MGDHWLINALGPDKTGLVEELSEVILKCGYNIEDSRMAVLGDHFSVLMLAAGTGEDEECLRKKLKALKSLEVTLRHVKPRDRIGDAIQYSIKIMGADTRGIVHGITNYLKSKNANVVSMETWLTHAPHSGTEVFNMHLAVDIPRLTQLREFREGLNAICDTFNLDADMEPAAG